MRKYWKHFWVTVLLTAMVLMLSACSAAGSSTSLLGFLSPAQPTSTPTLTPTSVPTEIPPTPTATATPAPTQTPTPALIQVKAGQQVDVPILLYHHIAEDSTGNRYFVSPEVFATQMQWLYDHHYQTITTSQLADVILHGGQIPERAVVITFDDGDQDQVTNALPIMKKYGFVGTAYIIVTWVGAAGYDTPDQIKQLSDAGWEIGSHTMSHVYLTTVENNLDYEIRNSLVELQKKYNVKVTSIAYPFGDIDSTVATYTSHAGYTNGVGLGTTYQHGLSDLYYLVRMEVRQEYTMDQFIALLPWKD